MLIAKSGKTDSKSTFSIASPIPDSALTTTGFICIYDARGPLSAAAKRTDKVAAKPTHPIELKFFMGTTYRSHKKHHFAFSAMNITTRSGV